MSKVWPETPPWKVAWQPQRCVASSGASRADGGRGRAAGCQGAARQRDSETRPPGTVAKSVVAEAAQGHRESAQYQSSRSGST